MEKMNDLENENIGKIKEVLLGEKVIVADNPEMDMFKGIVIGVLDDRIDGILISVLKRSDETFDIPLEYISLVDEVKSPLQKDYFTVWGRTATDVSYQYKMDSFGDVVLNFMDFMKYVRMDVLPKEEVIQNIKEKIGQNETYTINTSCAYMSVCKLTFGEYQKVSTSN